MMAASSSSASDSSTGAIIGGVVGGVVALAAATFFVIKKGGLACNQAEPQAEMTKTSKDARDEVRNVDELQRPKPSATLEMSGI